MKRKSLVLLTVVLVIIIIFAVKDTKHEDSFLLIDPNLYDSWNRLVLVNQNKALISHDDPESLVDLGDIVPVNDHRKYLVCDEVAEHLVLLLESFHDNYPHTDVRVTSAYRSYEYQKHLYESYEEHERHGLVATPGYSEHQTGLAIDIAEVGIRSSKLQNTEFYKYLENHAHEYGFIIRYPKNKQWITGVKFEPWHLRYVGKKHATIIFNSGLTFEEYWDYIYNRIHTV